MYKTYLFFVTLFFLLIFSPNLYSQFHTSLTDIYMGNYGFWDYQSTGSLQYVEQDTVNQNYFSAVYLMADSTLTNPAPRVYYYFSVNQGNTWTSAQIDNVNSYYPSLTLQGDGRAVVCLYDSSNSQIKVYRNASAGSLSFTQLPSPPSGGRYPKILFYRNYLILVASLSSSSFGQLSKVRFNLNTNNWETWQPVGLNNGTSVFQVAKGFTGKFAVCWLGDSTNKSVKYSESLDSAVSFGPPVTVFSRDITAADTLAAFAHIDMVYHQNIPCITWDAIARILPSGGQSGIRKFYHNPRIYFWNSTNGVKLVADSSNYGSGTLPGRNNQLSMGNNWSTICGPSIGISGYSSFSYIYILFSAAKYNIPMGNGWYDSDVYIKYSYNSGSTWNNFYAAVTTDNVNDDRHISMVKRNNPSGGYNFAFTVQKDKFPGSYREGDTTAITRAWPEFFYISVFVHTSGLLSEGEGDEFYLCPNYPNPFNPYTHIEFWLPRKAFVNLSLFDMLGRKVETLVNNYASVGMSMFDFDGSKYPSGVYIYRMFADGKYIDSRKMILLK